MPTFAWRSIFRSLASLGDSARTQAQKSAVGTGFTQLEDRTVPSVSLVRDINAVTDSSGGLAYEHAVVGTTVYFPGVGGLWKSDGTAAGTTPVPFIGISAPSWSLAEIAAVDGSVYFTAESADRRRVLWKCDPPVDGIQVARPVAFQVIGLNPAELTAVGGTLFFTADGTLGRDLWRTDGTAAGTVRVREFDARDYLRGAERLTAAGDALFFTAGDRAGRAGLWKSDGTAAGTTLLRGGFRAAEFDRAIPGTRHMTAVGDSVYFAASDGTNGVELWKSDGTPAGTVPVNDLRVGGPIYPQDLTAVGSTLYFTAVGDGLAGRSLWRSNGSAAGTVPVKEFASVGGLSAVFGLTAAGGTLFFSADTLDAGRELWRSDGTTAGTRRVKDIRPGVAGAEPVWMTADARGGIFFAADDGVHGRELWRSDGTADGTVLVEDILPGAAGSEPGRMVDLGGHLFLTADDGRHGREPWRSDGTTAGTTLVKDIVTRTVASEPRNLTAVGGTLYFTADDGIHGRELWKSDGTADSTVLVADIRPGVEHSFPSQLTAAGSTLYLFVPAGPHGSELWATDGTEAGTRLLTLIRSSDEPWATPLPPAVVENTLLFLVARYGIGYDLWRSDGTAAGTFPIKTFQTANRDVSLGGSFAVGDSLYFAADDGASGIELWRSDGTEAGTVLVKDIFPGAANSRPWGFASANGTLRFVANDGAGGFTLWASDGTEAGTVPRVALGTVSHLTVVGDLLYYRRYDAAHGQELWRSDGTEEGTFLVRDIRPGPVSSYSAATAAVGDMLYFALEGPANKFELWRSNGTEAGTVLVSPLPTGPTWIESVRLFAFGDTLFWVSGSRSYGYGVWRFDELTAALVPVVSLPDLSFITPSLDVIDPTLVAVGEQVFFAGSSLTYGLELWRTPMYPPPVPLPDAVSVTENGTAVLGANPQPGVTFAIDGGADAGRFALETATGALSFRTPPDFEAPADADGNNVYWVEIRVNDGTRAGTQLIGVNVSNANETPTGLTLSGRTVAESQPTGTPVGVLTPTDPDADDTFTFTLVPGAGDDDNSSFQVFGNELRTNAVFDFERQSTFSVRVRVTDAAGLTFEKVSTVTVADVNEAPVVAGGPFRVREHATVGTVVGTVTVRDPDAGDAVTFSLANTAGGRFAIDPTTGTLTVAKSYLLDAGIATSHTVVVRVTDSAGLSADSAFVVAVDAVPAPPRLFTVRRGDGSLAQLDGDGKVTGGFSPPAGYGDYTMALRGDAGGGTVVIGSGSGVEAKVAILDAVTGAVVREWEPFVGFTGGVNVAAGDVTGDGVADSVVAAGAGGGPHVKVFDGVTGMEVRSFFAFEEAFAGGVSVAVGDVDGDGYADTIVGAGTGGGPHVKVFSGKDGSVLASFYAYDEAFTGGVRVAAGDVDGDGYADVVTGTGPGGGPNVRVYVGPSLSLVGSFLTTTNEVTGGVRVAARDITGDRRAEVVALTPLAEEDETTVYEMTGDGSQVVLSTRLTPRTGFGNPADVWAEIG